MAEVVHTGSLSSVAKTRGSQNVGTIAWRNLWRNRRRTWLTSGGVAFAVWLLVFGQSMQDGSFEIMIDNGARLSMGHIQLQHPQYSDDPRMEFSLQADAGLIEQIEGMPHVQSAMPRAQGFALASFGERSFGALITGVDFAREARFSSLPGMVEDGRYLNGPGETVLGSVLAKNLGVTVGEEIVLLGTARQGGVAAVVATVVGTFATGVVEIDRSILQIPIEDFQSGWNFSPNQVHAVVILAESVAASEELAAQLDAELTDSHIRVLGWRELMPEAQQTIDLKKISIRLLFAIIAIIVSFSVVNAFMMTVFERTPEFGMLMAIGMRPGAIMAQLMLEALWLGILGVALGVLISLVCVLPMTAYGIPLPEDAAEILRQYNMPDRIYPAFSMNAVLVSTIIMLVGIQLAAIVTSLRIRRMSPVEALRNRE